MSRKELRIHAVMELMRETNERAKQGHEPHPGWCDDMQVKARMKLIRARRKAEGWNGLPPNMQPLAITGHPGEMNTAKSPAGTSGAGEPAPIGGAGRKLEKSRTR
jgi:hypothetical protein